MSLSVSVIGTGYVGLVSAACFASQGHDVTCVDVDAAKVDAVNAGRSFLHEPGLERRLQQSVPARLRATADLETAVRASEITLIAVPTPFDRATGAIDLDYVERAAEQIGRALRDKDGFHVVAVKSTCIPGTADGLMRRALERTSGLRAGVDFGVGSNPEFLSEGTAVEDFLRPDRIVIGGDCQRTRDLLIALHAAFEDAPLIATSNRTAELIKYASNALLATCISFANEIADVAEMLDGDVDAREVMRGVHLSRYLTRDGVTAPLASFLAAGCGYGGSCLPKDVAALAAQGRTLGLPMSMLTAVADVNDARAERLIDRVKQAGESLEGATVAVLGTAFKPGTADLRTSPAEPIIKALLAQGIRVVTFDPAANEATRVAFGDRVTVLDELEPTVAGADVIVIATAWPEFRRVPDLIANRRPQPLVVDGRRLLAPESVERYVGVGLGRSPEMIGRWDERNGEWVQRRQQVLAPA